MTRQAPAYLAAILIAAVVPARGGEECLVALRPAAPLAAPDRVDCRDGDVACDLDGATDGMCRTPVALCVGEAPCAAAGVVALRVRGRASTALAALTQAMPLPVTGPHCSAAATIAVRAGRRTSVRARARSTAGATDRDRVRLRCRPARTDGRAVIVTSNFETGGLATVGVRAPRRVRALDRSVHEDAVVRVSGGWVFVLNRFLADNVQVLDPARGLRTALRCPTGTASNPHDVVVAEAHKAYVTRYGARELWIVDPAARGCGAFRIGAIDLGGQADADGLPEMSQLALVDGRLFVSVQRLDRNRGFAPTDASRLVVIDTATDTVTGVVPLPGRNPFGDASGIVRAPGGRALWLALAGNVYRTGDGGIVRVDPDDPASAAYAVTEDALGGSPTDFVMLSATRGYALVVTPQLRNLLVAFDTTTHETRRVLARDAFLPDVALAPDGLVWVADQGAANHGIRIVDPATDAEVTRRPIRLALPPFSIGFLP